MKIRRFFLTLTASVLLASSGVAIISAPTEVQAANYSSSEAKKVKAFQAAYHQLDTTNYTQTNLYTISSNFAACSRPHRLQASATMVPTTAPQLPSSRVRP
ncbi:hypothetical protein LA664_03045 [Lactobacillus amylolyticus]|uniref:Uncharacterized protein n=1 Tax=Lactobacillus amylolyticus DSM 11664 TaxID=585524 RepID=D4YV90_9LACO|nr:hypothetical protein HMPREF0493_1451 [Lactobacillus amylolyticus DSM 11664]QFY04304.1 hypothetical protein LA664_03045 [Lactobacillus amylolyticus]TDG61910.1 hypothetical protein C5L18_001347 [Lactobacillus amylolyticus]